MKIYKNIVIFSVCFLSLSQIFTSNVNANEKYNLGVQEGDEYSWEVNFNNTAWKDMVKTGLKKQYRSEIDMFEDNDDFENAFKIGDGKYKNLTATYQDNDLYKVDLLEKENLTVAINYTFPYSASTYHNFRYYIIDDIIHNYLNYTSLTGTNITWQAEYSGTYYIYVYAHSSNRLGALYNMTVVSDIPDSEEIDIYDFYLDKITSIKGIKIKIDEIHDRVGTHESQYSELIVDMFYTTEFPNATWKEADDYDYYDKFESMYIPQANVSNYILYSFSNLDCFFTCKDLHWENQTKQLVKFYNQSDLVNLTATSRINGTTMLFQFQESGVQDILVNVTYNKLGILYHANVMYGGMDAITINLYQESEETEPEFDILEFFLSPLGIGIIVGTGAGIIALVVYLIIRSKKAV